MKNKTIKEDSFIEEDITEEEEEERRKRLVILLIFFTILIIGLFSFTFTRSNYNYDLYSLVVNIDLNGDGICDINCDSDGDNLPDYNIDFNGDNIPDINISYGKSNKAFFNISNNKNSIVDSNPINVKSREDAFGLSYCIRNCDINNDGIPDTNLDLDGDENIDLNFDTNNDGVCDYNCDVKGLTTPNYNVDVDNDGKADVNIGPKGEKIPWYNVSYGSDYTKPIFNLIDDDVKRGLDYDNLPDDLEVRNKITEADISKGETTSGKLNVDINNDGAPDVNIDLDGDGIPDINIDTDGNGTPNLNIDTNGDGLPDVNIDKYNDGTCAVNCDTDGDGTPDKNLDTNSDGVADTNIDENGDRIDLNDQGPYIIDFADITGDNFAIYPGWKGSKTFRVSNTSNKTLTYRIDFTEVENQLTEENNLYFGLIKNGVEVIDLKTNRAPYDNSPLISAQTISGKTTDTYEITFEFVDTNVNQDVDKGKTFYTKLQVFDAS